MIKIYKSITACLIALLLLAGAAFAQPANQGSAELGSQLASADLVEAHAVECLASGMCLQQVDLSSSQCCYLPGGCFVLIDSIDCAIDLIVRQGDSLARIGRFVTDDLYKRHDLKNILRPKTLNVIGDKIFFLASAAKDSSYLGILDIHPENGELKLIHRVGFPVVSFALFIDIPAQEIQVVGKNSVGYDIIMLNYDESVQNIDVKGTPFHYHVPKQSEKIQASDPVGLGLTVVAVSVVFLALICIALIIQGEGKAIMNSQKKRAAKAAAAAAAKLGAPITTPASVDTAGEVYAAISAAIYLYDEEMHDEEDTVITIQKVERAWTPWNAKFYNMNQYFNNRK